MFWWYIVVAVNLDHGPPTRGASFDYVQVDHEKSLDARLSERRPAAAGSVFGLGGGAGGGNAATPSSASRIGSCGPAFFACWHCGTECAPTARSPERSATMTFGAFPRTTQIKSDFRRSKGAFHSTSPSGCASLGAWATTEVSQRASESQEAERDVRCRYCVRPGVTLLSSPACTLHSALRNSPLRTLDSASATRTRSPLCPLLSALRSLPDSAGGTLRRVATRAIILVSRIAPTSGTPRRIEVSTPVSQSHVGHATSLAIRRPSG